MIWNRKKMHPCVATYWRTDVTYTEPTNRKIGFSLIKITPTGVICSVSTADIMTFLLFRKKPLNKWTHKWIWQCQWTTKKPYGKPTRTCDFIQQVQRKYLKHLRHVWTAIALTYAVHINSLFIESTWNQPQHRCLTASVNINISSCSSSQTYCQSQTRHNPKLEQK